MDKAMDMLEGRDIDFQADQEFSSAYVLHGSDEETIRSFFQQHVRQFFRDHLDLYVEGHGEWLVVFQGRLKPERLQVFWRVANDARALLLRS